MKPVPIFMKQWLEANERTRILPGDQWYLDFSIKTLPILKESPLFKESEYAQKDAATSLGMYFQDAIAQTGGWKTFSEHTMHYTIGIFPFTGYLTATSPMKSIWKMWHSCCGH